MHTYCRVSLGWDCNLECPYCCNERNDTKASFIPATVKDILSKHYDEIRITGGEPLLMCGKLGLLLGTLIDYRQHPLIYIYTNGLLLRHWQGEVLKAANVTGLTVGWHGKISEKLFDWEVKRKVEKSLPIRFLIQDVDYTDELQQLTRRNEVRLWHMDDCFDMPKEDRYLLSEG